MKNRMLSYDKVLGLPLLLLVSMLAGGCSLAEGPENPEPELTMLEPSGIGRREVTLSAVTDSRGGEVFSSVRFIYGESSGEKRTFSEDVTLVNGKGSITLDGLTPGSFYTSCAEAHYGTATIRSPYVSFSTLPIDPPALGSGALLSRGPTGFVLGFSVTDEGGDPITEAGCELTDLLTGQTRHEGVREALTGTGDYTVTVTRLNPGHRYSVTPYAANVSGFAWGAHWSLRLRNLLSSLSPVGCRKCSVRPVCRSPVW